MSNFTASFDVFSPRWGHADRYQIVMSNDEMRVSQGSFFAVCKQADNGDPEWSGYNEGIGNPLMQIFTNDFIYAPEIVPFALEWAWQQFRNGADHDILREGLEEVFSWIDQTAKSNPSSDLWQGAF